MNESVCVCEEKLDCVKECVVEVKSVRLRVGVKERALPRNSSSWAVSEFMCERETERIFFCRFSGSMQLLL